MVVCELEPERAGELTGQCGMSERQGRPEPSNSLYDILQVAPSATEDEIRRAYRRLALRYHPDKNPGDQAASAERFKAVQRAYRVLGDPRRRQLYDLYGSASLAEGFPDGQLWVLTSGWARCLLVAIFLATDEASEMRIAGVKQRGPYRMSRQRTARQRTSQRIGTSLYDSLGVARGASSEEIQRAYRHQMGILHPRRHHHDPQAVERYHQARRAYSVLGHPDRRRIYDRYGNLGVQIAETAGERIAAWEDELEDEHGADFSDDERGGRPDESSADDDDDAHRDRPRRDKKVTYGQATVVD
ncbi:uncharacterized protein LOC126106235 [Schistocerca cancellata]|uniref:uncharacterized protein LOC126106235 n=1 Tax=Schistocerca cancellata TaxID=274614 RepID=UPI0021196B08|nr:uncharacterized protein LOC126106235 [Schistocerca cancellata]